MGHEANDPRALTEHAHQRAVDRVLLMRPFPDKPRLPAALEWLRPRRTLLLAVLVLFAAVLAIPAARPIVDRLLLITIILLAAFQIVAGIITRRTLRRLLEPHDGLVCPYCHQPLSDLPETGQCPECGTVYSHKQVRDLWRLWHGLPRRTNPASDQPDLRR